MSGGRGRPAVAPGLYSPSYSGAKMPTARVRPSAARFGRMLGRRRAATRPHLAEPVGVASHYSLYINPIIPKDACPISPLPSPLTIVFESHTEFGRNEGLKHLSRRVHRAWEWRGRERRERHEEHHFVTHLSVVCHGGGRHGPHSGNCRGRRRVLL